MDFSVVISTFNRLETLPRAVTSVLRQGSADIELIVVNDGSTDGTAAFLDEIDDARVVAVNRPNGGLSAARNTGIARATGQWTTFLDDDDVALPGWLSGLGDLIDANAGVVCCGAEFRTPRGIRTGVAQPYPMGRLFADRTGLMLAGTFAARTDLLRGIGGYDERMTCSHQYELAMRLLPTAVERGLETHCTDQPLVCIERRNPSERPMSDPAALYHGTRVLLQKHQASFNLYPTAKARSYGILGVSAARLGKWRQARSALLLSARSEPLNLRRWLRVGVAMLPPVGRRIWGHTRAQEVAT